MMIYLRCFRNGVEIKWQEIATDMASDVNVTGIVFGAIFGALFVFTCIISAIKAVRDRKLIKERIAEKRRTKLEESAYDNYTELETREIEHPVSLPNISIEVPLGQSPSYSKSKRMDKSCTKRSEKTQKSPIRLNVPMGDTRETAPPWNYIPSRKATKNIIRRNSYDMAIGRYTVLCSKYGGTPIVNGTATNCSTIAYENSAYCENSSDIVL
ncbi:uncharacterized protein LOC127738898 [Mytilus californianus]|uniref:uncharacterized protein LOC127738898 n=1 Tax=Mytilus californianus TaxID=6549 RepID=UPI002246DF50|nr:uncharacterized protein LOC127738898 [Mytilus californianus]